MNCDYSQEYICLLLEQQLNQFLITTTELQIIKKHLAAVWERTSFCFKHSTNKYYARDGEVFFNPFHSGQWCVFLYYLSNTIYREEAVPTNLPDKIYMLNKSLNSCDLFYEVNLPDIFFLDHPLGTVIGRATIKNFFTFAQGCTVGNNKGVFPNIDEHVTMMSDSKVIGNCNIGKNVIIAANTYIKDENVPVGSIVFGSSPNIIIKAQKQLLL